MLNQLPRKFDEVERRCCSGHSLGRNEQVGRSYQGWSWGWLNDLIEASPGFWQIFIWPTWQHRWDIREVMHTCTTLLCSCASQPGHETLTIGWRILQILKEGRNWVRDTCSVVAAFSFRTDYEEPHLGVKWMQKAGAPFSLPDTPKP